MRALRWTVCLGTFVLLATAAVAKPSAPDFLLPDRACQAQAASAKPERLLAAWKQCEMVCGDGLQRYPSCSAPTPACCSLYNSSVCAGRGGLAFGSCTDGVTTEYCP